MGSSATSFFPGARNVGWGTLGALCKRASTGWNTLVTVKDASSHEALRFGIQQHSGAELSELFLESENDANHSNGTTASQVLNADNWCLVGVSKPSGTGTLRFHRYKFDTGIWTHENGTTGIADGTSGDFEVLIANAPLDNDTFFGEMGAAFWAPGWQWSDAEWELFLIHPEKFIFSNRVDFWPLNQPVAAQPIVSSNGHSMLKLLSTGAATGTVGTTLLPTQWKLPKYLPRPELTSYLKQKSNYNTVPGGGSAITVTFPNTVQANVPLVAMVAGWNGSLPVITNVRTNKDGTTDFSTAVAITRNSAGEYVGIFYLPSTAGGSSETVTITFTSSITAVYAQAYELTMMDNTSYVFDQGTTNSGSSTTPSTGTITSHADARIAFAVMADDRNIQPPDEVFARTQPGWSLGGQETNAFGLVNTMEFHDTLAGGQTISESWTILNSFDWQAGIATFRIASAGGGGTTSNNATSVGAEAQSTQTRTATSANLARVGPRAQETTGTTARTVAEASRVGPRSQDVAAKATTSANTTRVGASAQCVAIKSITAAEPAKAGARSQSTALHAVSSANATRVGADATTTTATIARTSANTARVGAKAVTTDTVIRTSANATRIGAESATADTVVRTSANATRVGPRAQNTATQTSSVFTFGVSTAGARSQSVALQAASLAHAARVGARSLDTAIHAATSANTVRIGAESSSTTVPIARTSANAARVGTRAQSTATQATGVVTSVASTAGARSQCTATKAISATELSQQGARGQAASARLASSFAQARQGTRGQNVASSQTNPQITTSGVARVGARAQCTATRLVVIAAVGRAGPRTQTVALKARTSTFASRSGARGTVTTGFTPEPPVENWEACVADYALPDAVVWPPGVVREEVPAGEVVALVGCELPVGGIAPWSI